MKTTVLLMALMSLVMFPVAQVFGQAEATETPQEEVTEIQQEEVPEIEIPAVTPAPSRVEPRTEVRRVARTRRSGRANMDARHCLDLHTNHEIIKCAEKYF
ncbi:MAG TPA: hypothetical protein VJT81_14560 [Burkholderiales bacterium]|nr:hypothetical protein [Burkholderiales bacterium]